jgi:hypothetical protein
MVSKPRSVQSSRWDGAIFFIIPGTSCLAWSLDIYRRSRREILPRRGLSRRDGAIVAWHEVPGKASLEKTVP